MKPGRRTALCWTVRLLGPCVVAAAALLMPDGAGATSFLPTWDVNLTDSTPGAASPMVFDLNLSSPDAQFSSLVAFIPPEFAISDGDGITNGAISGHINAVAKVGLINGACDSSVIVGFDLMDASTDPEDSIPLSAGVNDYDGNTLPDNVDYYPYTLSFLAPNIVPVQRLYGQIPVAGIQVPLSLVIFAPGAPIPLLPAFDPSLGYPTLVLLGDPFAVPYPNDTVSDYCTPLTATTTLHGVTLDHTGTPGNEAGQTLHTNPALSGAFNSIIFARSGWDADNDGIENTLDPCPLTPDPTWNPRSPTTPGDADFDGLPDSCDPDDSLFDTDVDGDQFSNRLDRCPLVPPTYLHYDEDRDGIGDDCDPFPEDAANGSAAHRHQVCVADTIAVGTGTPQAPPWTCPSGPDLPVLPRLRLFPTDGVQATGLVQTLNVYATREGGEDDAIAANVSFEVTGANPGNGGCLTDNSGYCQFNYQGLNPGLDTVVASATIDGHTVSDISTVLWVDPSPNDNFAAATGVASLPFEDVQYPIAATREIGEPQLCGGSIENSLWYSFTPEEDVLITAEVETDSGPMVLAAYTGPALNDLQLVQCDATYNGAAPAFSAATPAEEYYYEEYLAFVAEAGVTYHFQLGSQFGIFGDPETEFSIHESVMGDVNCSDTINAVDALGILRTSAGLPKPPCAGNGDVNCSGSINAVDALLVLRVSAALMPQPTSCPD